MYHTFIVLIWMYIYDMYFQYYFFKISQLMILRFPILSPAIYNHIYCIAISAYHN